MWYKIKEFLKILFKFVLGVVIIIIGMVAFVQVGGEAIGIENLKKITEVLEAFAFLFGGFYIGIKIIVGLD